MRPRSRDKKLQEEWAVPLKNVEDISEVQFSTLNFILFVWALVDRGEIFLPS